MCIRGSPSFRSQKPLRELHMPLPYSANRLAVQVLSTPLKNSIRRFAKGPMSAEILSLKTPDNVANRR
jgi:hypothetical protein